MIASLFLTQLGYYCPDLTLSPGVLEDIDDYFKVNVLSFCFTAQLKDETRFIFKSQVVI